ncbi:MAG: lactonase family protein [Verrucomicrobiales bacterium]|nr:lactonase family protein [Verrucomicrobiales bacterium]
MPTKTGSIWSPVTAAVGLALSPAAAKAADTWAYFGTYTGGKSKGIYVSSFDSKAGDLGAPRLVAETANPSFLAFHPSGKFLYAVGELDKVNGVAGGAVSAYAVDKSSGQISLINQKSSKGGGPCHLVVDATGRWVLVANYGGGSVAALPIKEDGSLEDAGSFIQHTGSSVNPDRQKEPHAHSINLDRNNQFAVVADLGLDRLLVYKFGAWAGVLEANNPAYTSVPAGSGPRHFAFHPDGRHAFAIHEILSMVSAYDYDAKAGTLKETHTVSTLPAGFTGQNSTAEVQVHPSGKFVYGSNRGHDSIAVYQFDARRGALKRVENEPTEGRTPRNFGIHPEGRHLLAANQDSDSVVVFDIDAKTGALTPNGQKIEVGRPVCVKFLKAEK